MNHIPVLRYPTHIFSWCWRVAGGFWDIRLCRRPLHSCSWRNLINIEWLTNVSLWLQWVQCHLGSPPVFALVQHPAASWWSSLDFWLCSFAPRDLFSASQQYYTKNSSNSPHTTCTYASEPRGTPHLTSSSTRTTTWITFELLVRFISCIRFPRQYWGHRRGQRWRTTLLSHLSLAIFRLNSLPRLREQGPSGL